MVLEAENSNSSWYMLSYEGKMMFRINVHLGDGRWCRWKKFDTIIHMYGVSVYVILDFVLLKMIEKFIQTQETSNGSGSSFWVLGGGGEKCDAATWGIE